MTSKFCSNKSVFILPLLLAATWPASPAVTAATTIENFRLRGDSVTATFEAFDPLDPCLLDFVSVSASDLVEKTSPGGKKTSFPGTLLIVIQEDVCTNSVLFQGFGGPAAHSFQVAGNLSSATLTAQVPVRDNITGITSTFEVNLTWKAPGKVEFLHSKETFRDPELGIRIMLQSVSFVAQATATGTVFGVGQNFTPESSDAATIQSQNDGTLLIQKEF